MIHFIEKTVFDFAFGSEEEAFLRQAELEAFVKGPLMTVAEEVFNELSPDGTVFRIDLLEIDLGPVAWDRFQEEMEREFRERLKELLQKKRFSMMEKPAVDAALVTSQQGEFEQVAHFLATGSLPWNVKTTEEPTVKEIFRRVVEESSDRFIDFLRGAPRRALLVRRLVEQFPEALLAEIIRRLAPSRSASFIGVIALFKKLRGRARIVAITEREFGRFLWRELFEILLKGEGGATDRKGLISRFLKKIPLHFGGDDLGLGSLLTAEEAGDEERERGGRWEPPGEIERALLRVRLLEAMERGVIDGITAVWPMLLREERVFLRGVLLECGARASVRRKIAWEFPEPMLREIVALLEPAESRFIGEVVGRPALFRREDESSGEEPEDRKRQLWEFTLAYLLVERGSRFNKRSYLESLLRQMAAHDNLLYRDLLHSLIAPLETAAPTSLKKEMLQLLTELAGRRGGEPDDPGAERDIFEEKSIPVDFGSNPKRVPAPMAEGEERALLRVRLLEAMERGVIDGITAVWPMLLREERVFLRGVLLECGARASVRRKIAWEFPEPMLREIVALLEPVESRFIGEVVGRPALFRREDESSGEEPEDRKRQLWEFTLAYLLVERGSRFNKRSYLESLLRQMAAHDNLLYRDLLHSLIAPLETAAPTSLKKEMLQLLTELAGRRGGGPDDPEGAVLQSNRVIRAYDLYEALRGRLFHPTWPRVEGEGNQDDLIKMIDDLASAAPWQLLRLFRELQTETVLSDLFHGLSARELRRLLTAFLSLLPREEKGESDLAQAIEAYVSRSEDPKRFYGEILERLILNQVIDFDEIIKAMLPRPTDSVAGDRPRVGAVEEKEKKADRPPLPADRAFPFSPIGGTEFDLAAILERPGPLSAGEIPRLVGMIDLFLVRAPQRLFLERLLESRDGARKIVDLLPEHLLTRLLFLLRPEQHEKAQQWADSIATAAAIVAPGPVHRLKWEWIFRYFFEEGRPYDERIFARRFADELARQAGASDLPLFRAALRRQLLLDLLPSTRERSLAIVRALSEDLSQKIEDPVAVRQVEPLPKSHAPFHRKRETRHPADEIYIANAGQVLAAPYLPRLFAMLNFLVTAPSPGLIKESAFIDLNASERAVHLLQFMVDGRVDAPEYALGLNKILCGLKIDDPVEGEVVLSGSEREMIEGLIVGMIGNWKGIGKTSIAGFREMFLQREGKIQMKEDAWHLQVASGPFDVLLDRLPWSFSTIKHPWMKQVVHVDWR